MRRPPQGNNQQCEGRAEQSAWRWPRADVVLLAKMTASEDGERLRAEAKDKGGRCQALPFGAEMEL